ncbi:hypothetical protein V502_00386 [Pseudogymnoascus sp. VKM F-4520 (FW-2644)]|nr:hypothetical protein V502_00386 [Pseudogymnoascus sp. VKM F-4520 (FW-2644)]
MALPSHPHSLPSCSHTLKRRPSCLAHIPHGLPGPNNDIEDLEKRFSDDILKIELSGPHHTNLSVVDVPGLLEDYPAHLHINILPDFQAMGGRRRLMAELMKKLNADRVRGIHLMKARENKGAEIFYSRVGFERYRVVMDGGESGEIGRKAGGGICMVFRNRARRCVRASSTALGRELDRSR